MTSVLLIAAAGADWPSFAARQAHLPKLAALAARGVATWVRSEAPRQGAAAWASLATGTPPEVHRLIGDEEAWAGGLRPLTAASWRAAPVWSRLEAAGVSTGSVDWPGVRPGAASSGCHVDPDFAEPTGLNPEHWALPLRCAPADAREALRDLRIHPADITGEMLAPLAPGLAGLDQSRDTGLPRLAMAMARAASVQAAATWLLQQRRPQAAFVHFGWLEQVRRDFEGVNDGPFAGAVDAAWRFLDGLVGHLAVLAGPDALVIVTSPGRFSSPGLLLAAGPGVTPADQVQADTRDIAPSVLARFGLAASDLAGRPILGEPRDQQAAPPATPPPTPPADTGLLDQVVAAGYRLPTQAPPSFHAQKAAELAAAIVDRGPKAALAFADEALTWDPTHTLALGIKAMALVALGQSKPLAEVAEQLMQVAPESGWGPLARAVAWIIDGSPDVAVPWLVRAQADRRPELQLRIATIWIAINRPQEAQRLYRQILRERPHEAPAHMGLAIAASARMDFRVAESSLQRAIRLDPTRPAAYLQLAHVYARTGRRAEASRAAATAKRLGADAEQTAAAAEGRLAE